MNFIFYNLVLLVASFPAILLFSLGVSAFLAPFVLFKDPAGPPKAVLFLLVGLSGLFQIYFWGLWAAFCVAVTYGYANNPEVTSRWLYFVFGFFWSTSLIGWLNFKELQARKTAQEAKGIGRGTILYFLVVVGAYIVFAIWPTLIRTPYGWALELLGLVK